MSPHRRPGACIRRATRRTPRAASQRSQCRCRNAAGRPLARADQGQAALQVAAPSLPGLPKNCRTRRSRGAVRAGQTNVAAAASGVEARNHNPSNVTSSKRTIARDSLWSSGKCRERSQCPNSVPMSCSRTPISPGLVGIHRYIALFDADLGEGLCSRTLGRRINKFPRWQFWPDMLRSAVMPG